MTRIRSLGTETRSHSRWNGDLAVSGCVDSQGEIRPTVAAHDGSGRVVGLAGDNTIGLEGNDPRLNLSDQPRERKFEGVFSQGWAVTKLQSCAARQVLRSEDMHGF